MKQYLFIFLLFWGSLNSTAQNVKYDVYAFEIEKIGWRPAVSEIAIGSDIKDTLQANIAIWLLKGNNGKIVLVDAGYINNDHPTGYSSPDSVLKKLNINPQDVTDIILTHPHWDHIGGINLFPNAMVWMQEADFNYFVGDAWQPNGNREGFDSATVFKIVQKNLDKKLTLVNGDSLEIIPGIRVFIGSRHTYESQYVLVNGTAGKTIIASDNIWFYPNLTYLLPIPLTFDAVGYVKQMKRMKTLVSDTRLIIPGHDEAVFSKFPKIADGVVKIEIIK